MLDKIRTPVFWAKAEADSQQYHPLIAHSGDVAAVMAALLRPDGVIVDRLVAATGDPDSSRDAIRRVLTYLAAIHDAGKANHGFQDKAGPLAKPDRIWGSKGHVLPLVETFDARLHMDAWRGLVRGFPWSQGELGDMLLTAVCHHGRPVEARGTPIRDQLAALWVYDARSRRDPLAEIGRIADVAREWAEIPAEGWQSEPFPWTSAVSHLFAGLLVTADWVGSSPAIFPFNPSADRDPEAYWRNVSPVADEAVRGIGLQPPRRRVHVHGAALYRMAFPGVFGSGATPTQLQHLMVDVALPTPGSRIFIESDTGSGKTEAVLALYARLRDAGQAAGLLFALPTRATASAMFERIQDCLASLHPGSTVPNVALAMGGTSALRADRDSPLDREGRVHDEETPGALRSWASEHAKRFFAAEVVVGTVDQVLLAGLPVRHAHHRLALLSRHLLVVDELHSYDRYMTEVLRRVSDFHSACGGTSAFLSATLSSTARHRLVGEADPNSLGEAKVVPYPAVFIRSATHWTQHSADSAGPEVEVRWGLASLEAGLDEAVRLARDGARVCILRNTVKEARATFDHLLTEAPMLLWGPRAGPGGAPMHSRYAPADRDALDRALMTSFGKNSSDEGLILVSTQVVEQSLDLDFDWMLTDLAPIDVLLQRAGRVHRHDRARRPAAASFPTLWVHAPPDGFAPRIAYRGPHGWGTVYPDLLDLELTRRTIDSVRSILLPSMARILIEGVYHEEARQRFVERHPEWSPVETESSGREVGEAIHGSMAALDFDRSYNDLASRFRQATDENIRTRIGDDRLVVELDRPVQAWFAPDAKATEMTLPLRVLRRADLDNVDDIRAEWLRDTSEGPVFQLGRLTLRYSPTGWDWWADPKAPGS